MNKEFKKIVEGKQTRYVLESATGGATSLAAVSSNSAAIPGMQRRSSLLTPEAEQKVPQKPRQGPLRQQTGAGKHKDKKRDDKQGKAKHKKPFYEDHEVSMASNELKSIYADAKELLALIQKYGEQGDLEAWQQSKITKAADYLNSVLQSVGGEHTDLDELKMDKATDQEKVKFFKMQADRFKQQGFPKAADQAHQQAKSYQPKKVMELEKPSGTLYIIVLKDRSDAVRVVGDFGTFPAEVQARASKVGIKDKEGRKERPLKVNFLMTDASQALAELDKALADVDFIGSEKAEFVFKNSAFETDIEAEVQELHDLISSGADERFKNYEEPEVGNEPARKLKGVDHYIVDPITGKRKLVNKPTKPGRQLGGHAVQQPKTYTYRLQRTDLAPKLRDMGFKFDGNSIILSKQQRDQLLAKMGDKQFGMIFGQGDRFAEGWKGGMAGAGIGAALTRSPSGAMTGYKVGSAIGDMVGKKESDQDSEEHMNQTVSDLHREIYGFGPGKQFVYEWQKMSYDEKAKVYNKLKHLAGKLEEARYRRDNDQFSYGGRPDPTDSIPQDSTAGQEKVQAIVAQMKQGTINDILTLKPGWGRSDLALMTATELNQILRDLQAERVKKGQSEGAQKKPNATTRHLRDYPVSDKDVAKPVKKPEKKKPEQGVAEGSGNNITYKQQKGKNKFSVEMLVDGKSAGIFQYDANSGRTIVELDPEYRGQKLGQRLILKGIYTAAMMGLDYAEDESRTQAFDNAMDSLADSGYIVNDNEYWYVTDKGEQFLKQGVAEGSLETDNMVSHIGQVIQSIYPRGGDKNTYMKLVAQEMPRIVKANPKLFRRAFGMAYDRFFHIDQDDDFDYTDYSMRKGERGMEEGVAGPKQCWPGHRKVGTQPGTGKNAGKRVNDCEKIKKEDTYMESLWDQLNTVVNEKAPPGDKYERMVKHIKKGYAKDGKISDKERSIAYATAWKAKNKAKK